MQSSAPENRVRRLILTGTISCFSERKWKSNLWCGVGIAVQFIIVYILVNLVILSTVRNLYHGNIISSRNHGIQPGSQIVQRTLNESTPISFTSKSRHRFARLNGSSDTRDIIEIYPPPKYDTLPVNSPRPWTAPKYVKILKSDVEICQDPGLKWIIYVHANAHDHLRRMQQRRTWANATLFVDRRTKVIFLIGAVRSHLLQNAIDDEFNTYRDIVQGDFIDAYTNLTLKAIMGLYFVSTYCFHVPYCIKADDDALANIFAIMNMVSMEEYNERFVACYNLDNQPILRSANRNCMKWCVPAEFFLGESTYIPYCTGVGYVTSTSLVTTLYELSKREPYFWIDDVFVTGFLLHKVSGVKWIKLWKKQDRRILFEKGILSDPNHQLFYHLHNYDHWITTWNMLLRKYAASENDTFSDFVNTTVKKKHYRNVRS